MSNVIGNGQSVKITDPGIQQDLDCMCGSKSFHVIVAPIGIRPGAVITKLQCIKCRNVFVVSENGVVGERKTLYKDHQNRKHHVMIAEPGIYYAKHRSS